ncbi:MAG: hypothetical protein QF569_12010 [Candidatus Poribacteria bacterium]|nr:hypothetical protein [Candidatus Poribacteria bacterium]
MSACIRVAITKVDFKNAAYCRWQDRHMQHFNGHTIFLLARMSVVVHTA